MKYAPANSDGLKPWVVTKREWGRRSDVVVYADSRADAIYKVKGRLRYMTATARRATPEDIA